MIESRPPAANYRADIDGLRGIAILLVIGFHTFPQWVRAGFIGVDIFFVISGFLISKIILTGLQKGHFSFMDFYGRRIRRLFPSLILLFSALLVFGWFALDVTEFKLLGKHVGSASFFFANFTMLHEQGYFDNAAITKPLLHLWSLSLEEQFYLFWPLTLLLLTKIKIRSRVPLLLLLAASLLFSLSFLNMEAGGFYLPQARMWELLLGALLAHLQLRQEAKYTALAGLLLIAVALLLVDSFRPFSSAWMLLPTLGAALIICASEKSWVNAKVLSQPALVAIGLISYPLYLFHWPLLSLATIFANGHPSGILKLTMIFAAGLLAWCSHRYVEIPVRFLRVKKLDSLLLPLALVLIGLAGFSIKHLGGVAGRYEANINDFSNRDCSLSSAPFALTDCSGIGIDLPGGNCSDLPNAKVLLLGDSHAVQLLSSFRGTPNETFSRTTIIKALAFVPALDVMQAVNPGNNKSVLAVLDFLRKNSSIEYVVIANYSNSIVAVQLENGDVFLNGIKKFVDEVEKLNKKVVWIKDNPQLPESPDSCARPDLKLRRILNPVPDFCNAKLKLENLQTPHYKETVQKLRSYMPNAFFYDPTKIFCNKNNECSLFSGEMLLYSDRHHLSVSGARLVVDDLISELTAAKF